MLELRTLSQWQPNISPQSGRARTSLGPEEPQTPFISMAAQTGAGPGPGQAGAHLSCSGCGRAASTRAARKRKACIWSTAGTSARPEAGEGADWDKGPKQEGERAKWAGKGARDPEAVHKTRQGKRRLHVREKLDKDGEGWTGQASCPVSDNESGREEKAQVKDKRIRSQELETGPKKCKRIVRKGKTNEREEKVLFDGGLSSFPSRAGT